MIRSGDGNPVLAGDIGGTRTRLGFFSMGKQRPKSGLVRTYLSRDASGVEEIVERFLSEHPVPFAEACFAVAGPVADGRCRMTNLCWDVSETGVKRHFGWSRFRLINDLVATALAIPLLKSRERVSLNRAGARSGRPVALVAPGTGLGVAFLVSCAGQSFPVVSEGGHTDFAPSCTEQLDLWQFLHKRFGHVSAERVLSGPGLVNIYSWLKHTKKYPEPRWLKRRIRERGPAEAISEAAIKKADPLCVRSLEIFVSVFGAVAGNLALTGMATGGVYLGGGISPGILPLLKNGLFMKAFTEKGRFKDILEKIPVKVICNPYTALLGAAAHALGYPVSI
ncbi:MAG: glucokinase [Deltaproteobacteria bacterium]|nr:MAG: glucokinase [Deltaproteobacteria bacterium]